MKEKTKQLLAYIAQNYEPVTVTTLMKLSYLIDLTSTSRDGQQISAFLYKRYKYGPFDKNIYDYLNTLVREKILLEEVEYTHSADEYIRYKFNESGDTKKLKLGELSQNEKKIIDEVLHTLRGCGAKALSLIAYKTKPMKAIGATFGGEESLNATLNLKVG